MQKVMADELTDLLSAWRNDKDCHYQNDPFRVSAARESKVI
jgi:hypothetical protein